MSKQKNGEEFRPLRNDDAESLTPSPTRRRSSLKKKRASSRRSRESTDSTVHFDDEVDLQILSRQPPFTTCIDKLCFYPRLFQRYVLRLCKAFGWRFVALVVIVYGVNQGIGEGWAFFAAQYLLTDANSEDCGSHCGLHLDADRYAEVNGFTNVPWQIKSVYGILSDTLPVQGYHRTPYILAAALSGCVSWFGLGVIVTGSVAVVAIFLLIANYSIASPDVIIDASVAERCRDRPEFASDLQTLCWGSFGLGKIISSSSAGVIYDKIGSRGLLGLTVLTSAMMLPPSLRVWSPNPSYDYTNNNNNEKVTWLPERKTHKIRDCSDCSPLFNVIKDPVKGILPRLAIVVCMCSIFMGIIAMTCNTVTVLVVALLVASVVTFSIYHFERKIDLTLAKASIYIFVQGAIQPSTSVMYLWFKEDNENCSAEAEEAFGKRPCFSSKFYSGMITVSYVFFVLGTAMYNRYFSSWSYKKIWFTTQVLLVVVNLLDLIWVHRVNLDMGIPDTYFFFGEELIGPVVSRLNTMPLFILAAKLCPPKMEGTLFALNMGLSNFGVILGTYMGNGILLGLGGVEGPEFHNLDVLVVIRSFARLLPIVLIPFLVPNGAPSDKTDDNETTSGGLAFKDSIVANKDDDDDGVPSPDASIAVLRRVSTSSSSDGDLGRMGGVEMGPMEVTL